MKKKVDIIVGEGSPAPEAPATEETPTGLVVLPVFDSTAGSVDSPVILFAILAAYFIIVYLLRKRGGA